MTKMMIQRSLIPVVALITWAGIHQASAHIYYTGRDFGTLVPDSPVTISSNTNTNFGWAEATTETWGDSHHGRFFRFTLTEPMSVKITVQQTGGDSGFFPGFSLYEGLAHLSPHKPAHDGSALSVNSRPEGKNGSLRALHDWSIGNDPTYVIDGDPTSGILHEANLRYFTYVGHAADGTADNFGDADGILGDGIADGWVTGTFQNLAPADYSIFVGGADLFNQTTGSFAFDVTITAIPEPSTYAFVMGTAIVGLIFFRRRRRK